ncbi:hypothetical protein HaGV_gp161 [Helicoverpa armigera granulovirus]|uniref:Uncharacterized protein n=1 Tax=Helicoverpa armigera granulovirus TaxID=489830 RepID=A9YN03_9BBAC|nr:hypothetical protein HaGV_gp161 [Helicoverpa armigera granulovirus]ABY47852.1 unknown [Helicoverpa armigera granulovirus]
MDVCDLPIVQRCLVMDSVSHQLKTLINKIGLLESYYMFGEQHPTVTQQSLENDMLNVTNTFVDKKILARISTEAEHQLANWYLGKFDYKKCTLMYFRRLLLDLTDQDVSLLRDLRKCLKTPQKKSMVDQFDKFAARHCDKIDINVINQRDSNIFYLITKMCVRIEKLSELRKKNQCMFELNTAFRK